MGISMGHILVVILVILVLFGAGRIPRLMEDIGKGISSFKKGLKEDEAPAKIEKKDDQDPS